MKNIYGVLLMFLLMSALAAAQQQDVNVPAEITPFVEANSKAIALETADLNGDGRKDAILVLEDLSPKTNEDDYEEGKRSLLILERGANDKLTLVKRNDKIVYCRTCGGVFGDPFDSVTVGAKTFTVNHYGGSAWRWANRYTFNYSRIDKTWQLVKVWQTSYHTSDPNKSEDKTYTPPKHFGKIDISDFDPQNYLKKGVK